jgi:uncharacterized glyoxalase superfamily protein PhnB
LAALKAEPEEDIMDEQQVVPMIHVPDVRAAVSWYESIGFRVLNTFADEDEMTFALLGYGDSQLMLNAGGRSSTERRDVDLYIRTDDVEGLYRRLKDRVSIQVELNDTFYGTREFSVRDLNGFGVTFGQDVTIHA